MFTLRNLNLEFLSVAAAVAVAGGALAGPPPKSHHHNSSNSSMSSTSMKMGGWQTGNSMPKPQNGGVWNQPTGGYGGSPGTMNNKTHNKPAGNGPWNTKPTTNKTGPWNQPMQTSQGKYTPKNGNTGVVPPWMQKPQSGKGTIYSKTCGDPHYCKTNGIKNSYGYCYKGFDHCHWGCRRWSDKYGCWFFFDTGCNAWYYYCQQDVCYYPCSYVPYQTYCVTVQPTYATTQVVQVPVQTTTYGETPVPYNDCPAPYGGTSYGAAAPYGGQAGYGGGPNMAQSQPTGPNGGMPMKLPPMPGEQG